jgi:mRNA interferase RelE/StbE
MYEIIFDKKVIKDLKHIDKIWQVKIIQKIDEVLRTNPHEGKRLMGNMSNFFRLRVGDYRIIYEIIDEAIMVEVIKIAHRKDVYK